MQKQRSHLWNGRVMMLRDYGIRDGVLRGSCFETDYASFVAWRDWEFPGSVGLQHLSGFCASRR